MRSIIVFISPKADTSDWSILFFATFYGKMIEWKQDDVLCAQQMLFFTYTLCMNTIIYEWFKITCEKILLHFSQLKDYFLDTFTAFRLKTASKANCVKVVMVTNIDYLFLEKNISKTCSYLSLFADVIIFIISILYDDKPEKINANILGRRPMKMRALGDLMAIMIRFLFSQTSNDNGIIE